jgi:hypothetical protein
MPSGRHCARPRRCSNRIESVIGNDGGILFNSNDQYYVGFDHGAENPRVLAADYAP